VTDTLFEQPSVPRQEAAPWAISYEVIAWGILLLAALLIRLAEIDTVSLSDREAAPAVTAWHLVHADAPGTPSPVTSPILLWTQATSFAVLGGTEFAARMPTALAGLGLVLLAFALRGRLGREKAFLIALLLACSPIAITASRTSDPAVWTALFGGGLLLAVWGFAEFRRASDAVWAAFLAAGLVLSGPGGIVLSIVLAIAILSAAAWAVWRNPQDLALEQPGQTPIDQVRAVSNAFPWQQAGVIFVATLLIVATGFFVAPRGISQLGDVVGGFISGFWSPPATQSPIGAGLVMLLLFDPLLIVFAIIGVVVLMRQDRFGMRERFLVAWAIVGGLALIVYRGNAAGAALWVTLPLTLLAVEGLAECFIHRRALLYVFNDFAEGDDMLTTDQYRGLKWLTGVVVIALCLMIGLHTQEVGRGLLLIPQTMSFGDAFTYLRQPSFSMTIYSGILLLVLFGFLIVGFFLAASIWGNANTLQGYGLGLMILMLVSGVGGGWKATTVNATAPGQLWQPSAVSQDMHSFRETLYDLSLRHTSGFSALAITVVNDAAQGIDDTGLVAWLLRDYPNAKFVNALEEARQQEIVLTGPIETPDLGGTYVGQPFLTRTFWTLDDISPVDAVAWFTLRFMRAEERENNRMVLWVRRDVFTHTQASSDQ